MSDDLSQAAESAEAAQSAVEPNLETPPPWGEDFDAPRAWKTITHQRDLLKDFESDAKFAKRLREDPDALKEFLAEQGYALDEDEEDVDLEPSFDEDPTADLRKKLSELETWRQQQEAEAGWKAFNKDVEKLAKASSVELSDVDRDAIFRQTVANGGNQKAAEKAFAAHVEYLKAQEKAIVDRYLKSKTDGVPTPPQAGKAGRAEFDPTDRKARKARFEQIVAGQQQ